ncbi:MAG: hypothetical protein ACE3L7_32395 [Candidatus Pristimantibacillus sp.]
MMNNITTNTPPRLEDEQDLDDWGWIAKEAAGGIVGSLAGEFVLGAVLSAFGRKNVDYPSLLDRAVKEITERVGQLIEESFIREWVADTNACRSDLITYMEQKNTDTLRITLEPKLSSLTRRFMSLDSYRGLGGFLISANLHLNALKFLVYNDSLKRLVDEYSGWAEKANNWTLERAKTNVSSSCSSGEKTTIRQGEVYVNKWSIYTSNWGGNEHDWRANEGGENLSVLKSRCEENRSNHYSNIVRPAEKRFNDISEVINKWRQFA